MVTYFLFFLPNASSTTFSGSPKAAKEILSAPYKLFDPTNSNPIAPIVGKNSLILQKGEKHQEEKKMMMPFFCGSSLVEYQNSLYITVCQDLDYLKQKDSELYLLKVLQEITQHIITRVIFGIEERNLRVEFNSHIRKYVHRYTPILMFFPGLRKRFLNLSPWDRFLEAKQTFESEIIKLLNKDLDPSSIISKLKKLYSSEISNHNYQLIIDQLKTLLIAGHETTAISLFWCMFYLSRNKTLFNQVKEEIGERPWEELLRNPLLEAVCNEAMRIHSPVPIILRSLNNDFEFMGKSIKKGENVGISLTLLHRNPDIYKNPHEFNPNRFIEKKYDFYEFAPFGGSNRRCLGANFAYVEMKILLIALFQNVNLQVIDNIPPNRVLAGGLTMGPERDIKITCSELR